MESKEGQTNRNDPERSIDDIDLSSSSCKSSNHESNSQNDTTIKSMEDKSKQANSTSSREWKADNFDKDYQLLKTAMARQSAKTDLQQQQRKYTLDNGFARNRRPLFQYLLQAILKICGWMLFLNGGGACDSVDGAIRAWYQSQSWRHKLQILATNTIVASTTLHHWIVGMALPFFLLMLVKYETLGPPGRILEEYFTSRGQSSSDAPSFFYTSQMSKKRAKDKDTGDFVLCLLENWSSAVIVAFAWSMYGMLASLWKLRSIASNYGAISGMLQGTMSRINICTRLLTRLGAAAAIHQYPSLLFELRRRDQPRPLCGPTAYVQQAVNSLLRWLPLGVASDLIMLNGARKRSFIAAGLGSVAASALSIMAPICHLFALRRIAIISKCSAVSLSEATSFPAVTAEGGDATDRRKQVKWRCQLRWRTPQRIAVTLRSWANYFFTGHVPLLFEMDDWKRQPIRFDEYSTEGTHLLTQKDSKLSDKTMDRNNANDDLLPHADDIVESLALIFRDRDTAIHNATQARLSKHQESYDTKTLDDVLGVAVQQTFGIGISYDFDHFSSPSDGDDVSIHQLRARMAKSAVRRKRELDSAMANELNVLHRLNENVVTATNKKEVEKEMRSVEKEIRERHANEVDRMRTALIALIPTNADMPKGAERYDSPIMVAEYVDLKAPVERPGELKATIASTPDSLTTIESQVRRDFGDEAADAYRQDEIAARLKEREMLSSFRQRYGELKDEEISQPE